MAELDLAELHGRVAAAAAVWAPGCTIGELRSLEGGTVGLVFSADVTDGPPAHPRIVIKVAPPGLPPVRNRDVLRQGRVMDALSGQPGVGVPPLLFSDPGQPDDIPPFIAMGFLAGECEEPLLEAERNRKPDHIVRGRSFGAARMLAALHHVTPSAIRLDEPTTTIIGEIDRWTRTLETVPDDLRTGYAACADALRATAPAAVPPVVVHGDYRLGNMLSEGDDVVAIIDWEIWSVSDPRIDISWFLFFTDEAGHPAAPKAASGVPTDNELLAAYEDAVGAAVADLQWFHALTRYKEAAAMALIAKLAVRRGNQEMYDRFAVICPDLIADAHQRLS